MSDLFLFVGEVVQSVDVFAQKVDIWMRPVDAEIERRSQSDTGALRDHLIRGLMSLPVGMPIPIEAVGAEMLLVLEEALEADAVEITRDSVVRLAIPPVDLRGLVKPITTWEDVQALTLLRTHAPRLAVASPPVAQRILNEIDSEVGVATGEESQLRVLREPGSRWVRPSWQRWSIAERAFRSWHTSHVNREQ